MITYLEVSIRAAGAFIVLLVITRLIGKEQLGKLTVSDFVNAIAIGSIGASMATDHQENIVYYVIAIVIFSALTFATNYLALKSKPFRKIIEGEPVIVVHNGKILEKEMSGERYNIDNLIMNLREKNIFNIADVEFAVLEPNGQLSVLLKSSERPVTSSDLNISTKYEGLPSELIVEGKIIQENLKHNNLSEEWLMEQLKLQNIGNVSEVSYASIDTQGYLYIDKYTDTD